MTMLITLVFFTTPPGTIERICTMALSYFSLPDLVLTTMTRPFLHSGFGDFLANMLLLWVLGATLETRLGRRRILAAALVLGAAFVALFGVGLYFMARDIRTHAPPAQQALFLNLITLTALYAANFLIVMTSVLVTIDTLRADHVGCYGGTLAATIGGGVTVGGSGTGGAGRSKRAAPIATKATAAPALPMMKAASLACSLALIGTATAPANCRNRLLCWK